MSDGASVYSPLGVKRMQLYRARIAALVKDRKLEPDEAEALIARKMKLIADRRG